MSEAQIIPTVPENSQMCDFFSKTVIAANPKTTDYLSPFPAIGKLFEKILYKTNLCVLTKNNAFSITQFGIRSKLSTVDGIASSTEEIRANWYKSKNLPK